MARAAVRGFSMAAIAAWFMPSTCTPAGRHRLVNGFRAAFYAEAGPAHALRPLWISNRAGGRSPGLREPQSWPRSSFDPLRRSEPYFFSALTSCGQCAGGLPLQLGRFRGRDLGVGSAGGPPSLPRNFREVLFSFFPFFSSFSFLTLHPLNSPCALPCCVKFWLLCPLSVFA